MWGVGAVDEPRRRSCPLYLYPKNRWAGGAGNNLLLFCILHRINMSLLVHFNYARSCRLSLQIHHINSTTVWYGLYVCTFYPLSSQALTLQTHTLYPRNYNEIHLHCIIYRKYRILHTCNSKAMYDSLGIFLRGIKHAAVILIPTALNPLRNIWLETTSVKSEWFLLAACPSNLCFASLLFLLFSKFVFVPGWVVMRLWAMECALTMFANFTLYLTPEVDNQTPKVTSMPNVAVYYSNIGTQNLRTYYGKLYLMVLARCSKETPKTKRALRIRGMQPARCSYSTEEGNQGNQRKLQNKVLLKRLKY